MAFDTSAVFIVGILVDEDSFNALLYNFDHLKGAEFGQTETERDCEVAAPYLQATGSIFDIEKQFAAPDTGGEIHFVADRTVDGEIQDGQSLALAAYLDVDGASAEYLGKVVFTRVSEYERKVEIFTTGSSVTPALAYDSSGYVALGGVPEAGKSLRIYGALNATGYLLGGASISDWTAGGGTLDWIGNASASRFRSRAATGAAPLAVSSTTVCPNVNSWLLDGHQWHPGQTSASATQTTVATSDTQLHSLTLEKAGYYEVYAVVNVSVVSGDTAQTFSLKLKDHSSVQFGQTCELSASVAGEIHTTALRGFVTLAASQTVRVTAIKAGGAGASTATAKLVAIWRGP